MKINYFFIAVSAVLLTAACQKEQPQNEDPLNPTEPEKELVPMTFTASCEDIAGDSTKVYFEDLSEKDYTQKWTVGDKVGIAPNGYSDIGEFTVTEIKDGHAIFEGSAISASKYFAVYPYSAIYSKYKDSGFYVTLPDEQKLDSSGTDPLALISLGRQTTAGGNSLAFYNMYGLIQFTLEEEDVTTIIIEGNNGETLAGKGLVYASENGVENVGWNMKADGCEKKTSITLKPAEGTTFPAGTYAAAVLPQTFTKGLKIIYKHSGDAKCSIKTINSGEELTISRNTCRYYSHDKLKPGTYKYYYITTKAELDAWKDATWTSSDVVYLGADIDYGDETWTTKTGTFTGTFNGLGHTISNLKAPLFNNIGDDDGTTPGVVKNLILNSEITYSSNTGNSYGVGILAHYAYKNSTLSNITTNGSLSVSYVTNVDKYLVGGIIGAANAINMTSCVNYASVSYEPSGDDLAFDVGVGGLIGAAQTAEKTFSATNKNEGPVAVTAHLADAEDLSVGGCFGKSTQSNTYECENKGSVTVVSNGCGNVYVGGVVGWCSYDSKFDGSTNSADISVSGESSTASYAGGIVGSIPATSTRYPYIKNAENSGSVTNNVSADNVYIGGIAGQVSRVAFTSCTNNKQISSSKEGPSNNHLYAGGIVGMYSTSAQTSAISGCTNNGKVVSSHTSGSSGHHNRCLGGIVGYSSIALTISNCTNAGEVENTCRIGQGIVCVGGIGGQMKDAEFTKCTNSGSISNTAYANSSTTVRGRIGGLVGYAEGVNDFSGGDNSNSGYIYNSSNCSYVAVGGIVGYADGASKMDNVSNSNSIETKGSTSKSQYRLNCCYLGGISGYVDNADATIKNSSNTGSVAAMGYSYNNPGGYLGGVVGYVKTGVSTTSSSSTTTPTAESTILNAQIGEISGATF